MKIIENENARKIVEILIPQEILDLKPVIAGGFIVSLYHLAIRYSGPVYNNDLAIRIKAATNHNTWAGAMSLTEELGIDKKFGDLDCWFLQDNEIWDPNHPGHFLVGDFAEDSAQPGALFATLSDSNTRKTFYDASKKFSNELADYRLGANIDNSSYWANSYRTNNPPTESKEIQFIKKSYEDIDELFSKFDILNCCAAFYDGKFYFHDDFVTANDKHLLMAGETFGHSTPLRRIWAASRSFKYAKRFSLQFSEEVCDEIVEVFLDANNVLKKVNSEGMKPNDILDLGDVELIDDPYGRGGKVQVRKVSGMIQNLFRYFPVLASMNTFNKERMFLFLNFDDYAIKNVVQKYLESETETFYRERGISPPTKEPEEDDELLDGSFLFDDLF